MGKLTEFSIALANPLAVYLPGQSVEGHVMVVLSEGMAMRGVRLKSTGGANVHWTETRSTGSGDSRRTETVHYRACEKYFQFEILVFGPGNDSVMMHAGHHTFPFQFMLPVGLPSSFEGAVGNVRYELMATIDIPWTSDRHTNKRFTIAAMLDLNLEPAAPIAADGQNSKMLCCLCCKSGPISAQFHIDRTGYVPGDTIYLKADISNLSRRRMCSSKVKLIMVEEDPTRTNIGIFASMGRTTDAPQSTSFHATNRTRTTCTDVAVVSHGEIARGDSDTWTSEPMVVPAVPPSYLLGCTIIDITYFLQLVVVPAGPAFDLKVPIEIIVGTVPLRQMQQTQMYPAVDNRGFSQPLAPSAPFHDPNMARPPPPSYAESVFGK